MSKRKNNKKANKGNQKLNQKNEEVKLNINDKEAENILNKIAKDEVKEEKKVETKKENKKENKPEVKEENKVDAKKENKKEAEEKLNEVNKSLQKNKKENKSNTDWLIKNEDLKISDKIMKISSSVWNLQLMLINKKYEFELSHKKNKNNVIKVRLRNQSLDLKIKFKETKDVSYKIKQVINQNGSESEKEYNKDYLELDDNIIPLDIILMPVFDFYFTDKKIRKEYIRYTEGNLKVHHDKITLDLNIRKEGYPIDPKGLSLESLKELMDDDEDNILGGSVEYFRRSIIVEEPKDESKEEEPKEEESKEEEPKDESKEEDDEMTASDKIVAIIEDCDPELKDKIMDDKVDNKFEIVREAVIKYPKAYNAIKEILTKDNVNYNELKILQIVKETAPKILNPIETSEDKYNNYLNNNEEAIIKMLDTETTNVGERSIKFVQMVEEAGVDIKDIKPLLVSNNNWHKFIWDYNPYADQVISIIEHIDECVL